MSRGTEQTPLRATAQHDPDGLDGLLAVVVQPMRRRRVERNGVARLEHVFLEADGHAEPAAQDDSELAPGVAHERVRRTRLAPGRIDREEELDARFVPRRQALPTDARLEVD